MLTVVKGLTFVNPALQCKQLMFENCLSVDDKMQLIPPRKHVDTERNN